MSFWFIPSRTALGKDTVRGWEGDLHPTDAEFIDKFSWYGDHEQLGNKSDAYGMGYLLEDFNKQVNSWASPEVVLRWGNRLKVMSKNHMLKDGKYWEQRADLFIALGNRGIGLYLSW